MLRLAQNPRHFFSERATAADVEEEVGAEVELLEQDDEVAGLRDVRLVCRLVAVVVLDPNVALHEAAWNAECDEGERDCQKHDGHPAKGLLLLVASVAHLFRFLRFATQLHDEVQISLLRSG